MQATVRSFSPATRSGELFLDDGTSLPFGPEAFDRSGLRRLRLGQRVRLQVDADGRVTALTIHTLPPD